MFKVASLLVSIATAEAVLVQIFPDFDPNLRRSPPCDGKALYSVELEPGSDVCVEDFPMFLFPKWTLDSGSNCPPLDHNEDFTGTIDCIKTCPGVTPAIAESGTRVGTGGLSESCSTLQSGSNFDVFNETLRAMVKTWNTGASVTGPSNMVGPTLFSLAVAAGVGAHLIENRVH
jgi:hypothetical protein